MNLFLEVLDKRPDGYHEIETVMQTIDLCDEVELKDAKAISIRVSPSVAPEDNSNLCWRAADLISQEYCDGRGVSIKLKKKIPVFAGLGGGSSNAAAVLRGLNEMWELGLGIEDLAGLAVRLGADVPFFLCGGTAVCRGIGEEITPVESSYVPYFVLVCPPVESSTAGIYKRVRIPAEKKNSNAILDKIGSGDLPGIGATLFNRLQEPACEVHPEIEDLLDIMREYPFLGVMMSGSGSSVFGLAANKDDADEIAKELRGRLTPEFKIIATAGFNFNKQGK